MKKLVSMIVMLSLIVSCFSLGTVHASSAVTGEFEFAQLSGLGLMVGDEDGNANLGNNMTRAEFAQLIKNLLTYKTGSDDSATSGWAQNFFGENTDYNELKVPSDVKKPVKNDFSDVPSTHWAYETVAYIRTMGIMRGTSETTFAPDANISTNEVVKTLMVLLGYETLAEQTGGYPGGYMMHANRIKLLSGINPGTYITRGEIAVLVINTLDANVLTLSGIVDGESYEYDKDDLFAVQALGLRKVSGLMTDNGFSTLLGKSTYDGEYIVIGDYILENSTDYDCSGLLGREVDCWYMDSSTKDPGRVVFVCANGTDKFVEIDSSVLEKTSLTEIYYRNESGSLKKENIANAYVIYNGVAINSYTADIFDITTGSIQICDTDSSKYGKIVYVNEPETWYVNNVDAENNVIYNALKEGKSIKESDIIRLDFEDPSYKITIYNEDGSLGTVANISKGSVLDIVRSGKVIKIKIVNKVLTDFTVTQISSDYRGLIISDDNSEYVLTKEFENYYLRDEIRAGDNLTLYLNSENRVAWATTQANSDLTVAHIVRAGKLATSGFDATYALKLYNVKGILETLDLAEKVTVSDSKGKVSRMDAEDFYKLYSDYAGICRYSANDDDQINYVEFPILDRDTSINGKLHLIMETNKDTAGTDGYFVHTSVNSFGAKALLNTNTKVFCYNPEATDEDQAFSMATYTIFGEKTKNIVKLYTDVEGSPVAKYAVRETESLASSLGELNEGFVVKKVVKGIHPDEDTGDIIKAVRFKFRDTVRDEDLYLEEGVIDNIEVEAETKVGGKISHAKWDGTLEPGDIIRVSKNSEGMVTQIRIVWDENGTDDGGVTPGSMPGMSEYYHTGSYNTNPWAVSWNADASLYSAGTYETGILRVCNAFPYNIREGAMRLTTYDLPANGYENVDESKYLNEVWNIVRVVVVDLTEHGKITVTNGTSADIRPYDEFGSDCSRIVTFSRSATIDTTVVINGYADKK